MRTNLGLVPAGRPSRAFRDRLELLTALVGAASFDPLYRSDVIDVPAQHPVYAWGCRVGGCGRSRRCTQDVCHPHHDEWLKARASGMSRAAFLERAEPLASESFDPRACLVCPEREANTQELGLCQTHYYRWRRHSGSVSRKPGFAEWMAGETAYGGHGDCRVTACSRLAWSPLGLCRGHLERYRAQGRPGGGFLPVSWFKHYEMVNLPVPVGFSDKERFRRWCETTAPVPRPGQLNLIGLQPLVKAEIQWGLRAHAQRKHRSTWYLNWIQQLANLCRQRGIVCLDEVKAGEGSMHAYMLAHEICTGLRPIYASPSGSRDSGFLEPEHFGRSSSLGEGRVDLTGVCQRWLRDLLWDHLAALMRSPQCPISRSPFDNLRKACLEMSVFLVLNAPTGGHDPRLLRAEHTQSFVADQRNRARDGLAPLGARQGGRPVVVTESSLRTTLTHARKLLYGALESGQADRIGLDKSFITAMPQGGRDPLRSRNPFTDEVARALADEGNLRRLEDVHDPCNRGVRDVWETIVVTGRRCGEVLKLRLDCIGHYSGLPMLWHDQTKVGNFNEGIRIPERLYARLDERRSKTVLRFEHRHARLPSPAERAAIALFPSQVSNPGEDRSISYTTFHSAFKAWVDELNLGSCVPHQARHTLATKLLRHGATLTHIKRYLGQVSERMAEHYTKVAGSELDDILARVWVAGPGAANPGELLSGATTTLSPEEAQALALDLSRHSTPAQGGFCTFQPVVDGGACPNKLDCHNCDKFVLSGADLLYWRRKQEQWRSIAERAPDDATADYLHEVFAPTAQAIEGLEKALAGLGLLDQALALDLRRPQDYFHRLWNTGFRATDLAGIVAGGEHPGRAKDELS